MTIFSPAIYDEHNSSYECEISMEVGSPLPCNSKEVVLNFFFGIYSHLSRYDCSKVRDLDMK